MSRSPEVHNQLHPTTTAQLRCYLLRHWRYREARLRLLRSFLGWARPAVQSWRARRSRKWRPDHLSLSALLSLCQPGDLLLDADGAELFWLEQMLAGAARPVVVYRSDIRATARYNYHPVETVWLLEQAGYCVQVLTAKGPITRPKGWHERVPGHLPSPWLLATPPSGQESTP